MTAGAGTPPPEPTWTPLPAAAPPPAESGMLRAGKVLLLVGACLWLAMSLFVAAFAAMFSVLVNSFPVPENETAPPIPDFGAAFGVFYGVWAVLGVAGSICGFLAWGKARRGDLDGGFTLGLVGALLPPVNIVGLLGAIFVKTCPEAARPRAPPGPR